MLETIKKSVEETDARVRDILDFIKSDYPKASSQKEHEHNIEIVDYAVNQCKYGLKEKLRESFNQALLTSHLTLIDNLIKELEGKLPDERKVATFGEWQAETYEEKMLARAVLTDTITTLQALREEINKMI